MGKKFKSSKIKKFIKQALCVVLAVALIEGDIPLISNLTALQGLRAQKTVKAEGYSKYDIGQYTKTEADGTTIRIESWSDLSRFSKAYYEASQGTYGPTVSYANRTVHFVIQSNEQNSSVELTGDFEPIGNDDAPFAGKLLFDGNSQDMFNLDAPLFGTVYDSVKIAFDTAGEAPKPITITRTANKPGVPLLAYKVIHDENSSTPADWRFIFEAFASDRDVTYGGVIGLIDEDASVALTVTNNALAGTEVISDATGTDARQKDVGALCGVMGENATLVAYYSGSNNDYPVTSVHGNAGGLIGSMNTGSSFELHAAANLQGQDVLVYAQDGYAGGIVGKNLGGTVSLVFDAGTRSSAAPSGGEGEGSGGKRGAPSGTETSEEGDEKKGAEDGEKSEEGDEKKGAEDGEKSEEGDEKKGAEDGEKSEEGDEKKGAEDGEESGEGTEKKGAEDGEKSEEGTEKKGAEDGEKAEEGTEKKSAEGGAKSEAGTEDATAGSDDASADVNVQGSETPEAGDASNIGDDTAAAPAQGGEEATNGGGEAVSGGNDGTSETAQGGEEASNVGGEEVTNVGAEATSNGANDAAAAAPVQDSVETANPAGADDSSAVATQSTENTDAGSIGNDETTAPAQGGEDESSSAGNDLTTVPAQSDANVDAPAQSDTTSTEDGTTGEDKASTDGSTVYVQTKKFAEGSTPETRGVTLTAYPIKQFIVGSLGAGGLFGYYKPDTSAGAVILDVSKYEIDCKVSAKASGNNTCSGGLFGVIEIDSGTLTVSGASDKTAVVSEHASITDNMNNTTGAKANYYGGIAAAYKATSPSAELVIENVKVTEKNTLGASIVAGGISTILNASYVAFSSFELTSATNVTGESITRFGGLVSDANKAYVYAKDIVIGTSGNELTAYKGAGIVARLVDGVLRLDGTIDLTYSAPQYDKSDDRGQIVGYRDNTLIFAEDGWNYVPNATIDLDNVGSWGDVITFGSALSKASVFTETDHIITIGSVDPSAISDAASLAKASILFQIDVSKNDFIADSPTSLSDTTDFTFTDNVVLTGTGLRGLTRDNGSSRVELKGSIAGSGKTITLDIKNVGGTNRPVYHHKKLGLVGVLNPASGETYSALNFGGSIFLKAQDASATCTVGALSAQAKGNLVISDCNTTSNMTITINGGQKAYVGGLIGWAETDKALGNITVTSCTFEGKIEGSNSNASTALGGLFGKMGPDGAKDTEVNGNATWSFDSVSLKGSVKNTYTKQQHIAGLAAEVDGYNKAKIIINDVTADGLTIDGSSTDFMGGLLGYLWNKTDVEIESFSTFNASDAPTVKLSGTGSAAGIVYRATGHWVVEELDLRGIKMDVSSAKSVGMIVNKGTSGSGDPAGIYLELPAGYDYKLSFATGSNLGSGVFDEICAYSATDGKVMENGQGIISISTTGLTMEETNSSYSDSLSYKNRTAEGKKANPNSRYYYNLDTIDNRVTLGSGDDAKKLMRWSLNQYAASNIEAYFPNPFGVAATSTTAAYSDIPSANYDMKGYSWYPVTPNTDVKVAGTFTFYNKEFDGCENEKQPFTGIAASDVNKFSPLEETQHYMMQNGLLYNANHNVTLNAITLKGSIGAVDGNGTGALIYGTVAGSSSKTEDIVVVDSTNGSISLDGIHVWNLSSHSGYAPLLINKASKNATFNISNVSTTNAYTTAGITDAATSLIGVLGCNNDSEYINVAFTKIKLDGRTSSGTTVTADYNTAKSIFTRATLLERLHYTTGGSGTYIYSYEDDWGSGNHNVTYGEEVGYTLADSATTQYPGEELWYAGEPQDGTGYSVHPTSNSDTSYSYAATFRGSFLPYVKDVSLKASLDTEKKYQLMVNHAASETLEGCGTYNDPYIIKTGDHIEKLSYFIRTGTFSDGDEFNVPKGGVNKTWGEYQSGTNVCDHTTYRYTSGAFYPNGDTSQASISANDLRIYLTGAYYMIDPNATDADLTIDDPADNGGFQGLGISTADYRFRGVIVGNNKPSQTRQNIL